MKQHNLLHSLLNEEVFQREALLRLLVANSTDYAIFVLSPEGFVKSWNEGAEKINGYKSSEIIGQHFSQFYPQEAVRAGFPTYELETAKAVGRFEDEGWRIRKDGSRFWANVIITPLWAPDGELLGFSKITRDLTARKEAEDALMRANRTLESLVAQKTQALEDANERYRLVIAGSNDGFWDWDLEKDERFWSDRLYQILGMKRPLMPLTSEMVMALIHPDDRERVQVLGEAHLKDPNVQYEVEFRLRHRSGAYRTCISRGEAQRDGNGKPVRMAGMITDITERKEAEERQQKALMREKLIRGIVEVVAQSFDISLILKTVAEELGRFLQVDQCFVNHCREENGTMVMKLGAQYVDQDALAPEPAEIELSTEMSRCLGPEVMARLQEETLNMPDQETCIKYLEESLSPFREQLPDQAIERLVELVRKYQVQAALRVNIFYRGKTYGSISLNQCAYKREWQPDEVELVKIIADHAGGAIYQAELYTQAQATALKEQQAREESEAYARKLEISNRELEEFASIASHDLQEPLRKVQLFSGMLAEKTDTEGKMFIERIQNATSRMQHLISDLLILSRVTRQARPFRKVNLDNCLQGTLQVLEMTIQETGARIVHAPLGDIDADESQIIQLFQNLLSNALKFRKPDVAPIIEITGEVLPDGLYRLMVRDNGIGFEEKYKERIFMPFERVHGKFKFQGTGIGLAICQRIAERHNGTIAAQSAPDQGALFTVLLPINQRK